MEHGAWSIKIEQAGERLDRFLVEQLHDVSRSTVQKWIQQGFITVNGKKAPVHRFLKRGDQIEIKTQITNDKLQTANHALRITCLAGRQAHYALRIIDESPDYLVIDKPAGLLVHPDAKTRHGTLVDLLLAHEPKIAKVGEHPDRPGIVHRLDREVSGLMVIAKTQPAYEYLQKQFRERSVEKKYLALVHGEVRKDEGEIKFRIGRSKSKPRMAARPMQEEGKAAWTHYKVKRRFKGVTLLELEILSGRTHQIRAHLHALGHPIMGDTLYALRRPNRHLTSLRLMLQSIYLSFHDPTTGKRKTFDLPPDPAFQETIANLKPHT